MQISCVPKVLRQQWDIMFYNSHSVRWLQKGVIKEPQVEYLHEVTIAEVGPATETEETRPGVSHQGQTSPRHQMESRLRKTEKSRLLQTKEQIKSKAKKSKSLY